MITLIKSQLKPDPEAVADPKATSKIVSNDPAEVVAAAEVDMTANEITKMAKTSSLAMTLTTRDPEHTKTARTEKTRIEVVEVKEAAGAEVAEVVAEASKIGKAQDQSFKTILLKNMVSQRMKKK